VAAAALRLILTKSLTLWHEEGTEYARWIRENVYA
jgi:hypothetical protein